MRVCMLPICLSFAALAPVILAAEAAPFSISEKERAVIDATNAERVKAGVPEFKANPVLMQAARQHSENMALQDTLAHELDGRTPEQRVKGLGYDYFAVAENVSWN